MSSEASERLVLPWVGEADAREETGCNEEKGNGWPRTDDVDIRQLAMVDVEGTATEEDICGGGKENLTWVA